MLKKALSLKEIEIDERNCYHKWRNIVIYLMEFVVP